MAQPLLVFSPTSGKRLDPHVCACLPSAYRGLGQPPWSFNPWTGALRREGDIETDPQGLLIWEPSWGPKSAAKPKAAVVPLSAPDILDAAAGHMRDRAATYDQPGGERSMARAVAALNTVLGRQAIAESEGWLLLQLLKDVRDRQRSEAHQDSLEDSVAYAALKAEARLQGK